MNISNNSNSSRYEWVPQQVQGLLADSIIKTVADVGTGDTRLCGAITNAGGEWYGYDVKPSTDKVQEWNIEKPPECTFPKPVIVLMLDVLEHLCNPWCALQNISEHLLPSGYLILTTPNPLWSRSRLWALATGTPACFTQSDLDLNHHVFTPWPHIVERLLSDCGMAVIRYETLDGATRWPAFPFTARYPLRFAVACVCKWIEQHDRAACGQSYGIVAQKLSQLDPDRHSASLPDTVAKC
ncbi:MAG: class I SAM-dependent methyltransferase [Chthoniobacterales bacterium]